MKLAEAESMMQKTVESTQRAFNTIRTGRANASLLDKVQVEYYGTPTSLKALTNISTPDSSTILIQPYDKGSLNIIEKAISLSDVGLTPSEISEKLGIPNGTLSFHLKELSNAKLILVERKGRNLIYRPAADRINKLSNFLLENCCGGKPCMTSQSKKKVKC